MTLTILTATHNRAHLLPRLFDSIKTESLGRHDIQWILVDDGSDDGTRLLAEDFASRGHVNLVYVYKKHGGKHRALNVGFDYVAGQWVLLIDSDDWFLPGGLERVLMAIAEAERLGACMVQLPLVVPKANRQHYFQKPNRAVSWLDRVNQEPPFDSCLVFSKTLISHRFAEFEGEFFLAESSFMNQIADEIVVYLAGAVAVCAEYQPDGLSACMLRNRMSSPLGSVFGYQQKLKERLRFKLRIRALANFGRFWWHGIRLGRRPASPKGILQYLVLTIAWAFTVVDLYRERHQPMKS